MSEEEIAEFVGPTEYAPEPPELFAENVAYLSAFMDLATSRPSGFGLGPIPVSEIGAYWDRGPHIDEFVTFLRMIRAADNALLAWQREKDRKRDQELRA